MGSKFKQPRNFMILFILLLSVIVVASISGSANITAFNSIKIIFSRMPIFGDGIDLTGIPNSHMAIIWNIRLPRILLAFFVGFGLSVVGVALQGLLKNPMADPFIMGTSSGAALGAAIAILLKLNRVVFGVGIISVFAFFGALLATLIVYHLAKIKSKVPVTTLLLGGIAVGQLFTAMMSFIMVISSKDVTSIVYWTMGSFSSRGWNHLQVAVIPIVVGSGIIYIFAKDLNILLLGESTAQNTGVEVEKVKGIILAVGALVTAFAVSVSGIIGFVGLIIPHIVRMIVGPDHRILIPASALLGGIFLILADTLARTVISPTEIPVGIITALAGGPFFIYLLRKSKRTI